MSTIQNTVRRQIRTIRKRNNMSQCELAKLLGVSQGSITAYETGVREPSFETLYRIARVFCVSISSFFEDYAVAAYFDQIDIDRLKAFHQDPRLTLLFDKIRKLSDSDYDLIFKIINRMQ